MSIKKPKLTIMRTPKAGKVLPKIGEFFTVKNFENPDNNGLVLIRIDPCYISPAIVEAGCSWNNCGAHEIVFGIPLGEAFNSAQTKINGACTCPIKTMDFIVLDIEEIKAKIKS